MRSGDRSVGVYTEANSALNFERNCRITGEERSDKFIDNAFCTLLVASLLAVTRQNCVAAIGASVFTLKLNFERNLSYSQLVASLLTVPHLSLLHISQFSSLPSLTKAVQMLVMVPPLEMCSTKMVWPLYLGVNT